ncbi:UNVERIFIED_CONTAM: putative leucine-rich repeat receptor-like protein kinase [Sesamum angustifolium]|uniref:Leucine-rich repeat receptor-like protein kinase n=1 Tax=Sesamum angustifolium TaxID=2727405 RepID=A0AAW2KPK0_9LAMI
MHFSACRLDFSTFPYKPIGGCTVVKENLKDWSGFPISSCQNALLVFSHALAVQVKNDPSGNIFISQDQWSNCSGPFPHQRNVSVQTCGFDYFFYGSSRCSTLQLSDINQYIGHQCSRFGSSSFDDACETCTEAISTALDSLMKNLKIDRNDPTEKAVCLVSLIVLVIAGRINRTSATDDLDRCLPGLAVPEPVNYIKLNKSVAEALLAVFLVMIGLTAVITLIKYITRKQEKKPVMSKDISTTCSGLYRFSKAEIDNAINYGNEKKCLGRGSAGQVFKGMLPSGQLVAIKQIYKSNTSDSFTREIDGLSRVRHPNLVCLFGYCMEEGEQYLVYEYCSNGNLAQQLLRKDTVLTWDLRVKILRDCAFALKYLHAHMMAALFTEILRQLGFSYFEGIITYILTNILLTHNMEPKLSDFGLARMLGMEESNFGIVTLQLLSGQRVIELDLDARDQLTRKKVLNLENFAGKDVNMGKRPLTDFQDPRMKNVIDVDFESILQIAVLCVASSSTGRPTIDLVYEELEKALENTQREKMKREQSLLPTPPSKSQELTHV